MLAPHMRSEQLSQGHVLYELGDTISRAYFPLKAVVSMVVTLLSGQTVEAAMVGRDGVVGGFPALDGRVALNRAIIQIAGTSLSCDVGILKQVSFDFPAVHSLLIRHEQTVFAQAQQSAACMATHNVEARLARWMLRARDLAESRELPFTQEFLAEMLGVHRPSVSLVAHTLQSAGLIRYRRGRIEILNEEGLLESACECYTTIREQYEQLLGA